MITKQTVKRHWIGNIFSSMGLSLLVFFFLSVTAECYVLQIQDNYCSDFNTGQEITFTVQVENARCPVREFGFTVSYDEDVLKYKRHIQGDLTNNFVFDVKMQNGLTIYGHGYDSQNVSGVIKEKASGELIKLVFILEKCEHTTLGLSQLKYDLYGWSYNDGYLKTNEEKATEFSYSSHYPGTGLPILGYSYTFPQWYSTPYLSSPTNYNNYGTFQGLNPFWQPTSYWPSLFQQPSPWQPNLYQQPTYSQSLWPFWSNNQYYYSGIGGFSW